MRTYLFSQHLPLPLPLLLPLSILIPLLNCAWPDLLPVLRIRPMIPDLPLLSLRLWIFFQSGTLLLSLLLPLPLLAPPVVIALSSWGVSLELFCFVLFFLFFVFSFFSFFSFLSFLSFPSFPSFPSVLFSVRNGAVLVLRFPPSSSAFLRRPPLSSVVLRFPPSSSAFLRRPPLSSVVLRFPPLSSAVPCPPPLSPAILCYPPLSAAVFRCFPPSPAVTCRPVSPRALGRPPEGPYRALACCEHWFCSVLFCPV